MHYFASGELSLAVIFAGFVVLIATGMVLNFLPGGFFVYGIPSMLLQSNTTIILRQDFLILGLLGYAYMAVSITTSLRVNGAIARSSLLLFQNKDMLVKVEEATHAKSQFLAAASHDLRQPLHALTLLLTSLSYKKTYDLGIVSRMQKSVKSLEKLFTSLLDISKLDAGAIEIEISELPLNDVFSQLQDEFQSIANEKNIQFSTEQSNLIIHTDPIVLQRIISNLLANAFKYTSHHGTVALLAEAHSDMLWIKVRDNGHGIPKNQQEKIFSEFTQLDNPERDRSKGLGLGLAIVNRLCNLLDYTIELNSKVNAGTEFIIKIPLSSNTLPRNVSTLGQNEAHLPQTPSSSSGIILIIDDEQDIRDAMHDVLHTWGYTPLSADSLNSAIRLLDECEVIPDLIISDYRLRDNELGTDAIKGIHKHVEQKVPAFLITGDTHPKRIKMISESGYTVMHKPIDPDKLKQQLDRYL